MNRLHAIAVDVILETASAPISICSEEELSDRIAELTALRQLITKVCKTRTQTELQKLLIDSGWDTEFVEAVLDVREPKVQGPGRM